MTIKNPLPKSAEFGCSFCSGLYRTHVEGPACSVSFRFASDNSARMLVSGTPVFDQYFIDAPEWCTTSACCSQCCDSVDHCFAILNAQPPFQLDAQGLSTFKLGTHEIVWEVHQETGASGFITAMSLKQ